jgi:Ran GTPase-activating protein (RanGAP) involved in mRNA processing and transport
MGDMNIKTLCECLKHSNVTYLNFSKNDITNLGAEYIAKLLPYLSEQLNVLFLHWNKISGKGGSLLAKAITKHKAL